MHFRYTIFCVDVVDCILLAWHSDRGFVVVNSILEYACVISDKHCLDKTELL